MSGHCVIGRYSGRLNISKMIFADIDDMKRKRGLSVLILRGVADLHDITISQLMAFIWNYIGLTRGTEHI